MGDVAERIVRDALAKRKRDQERQEMERILEEQGKDPLRYLGRKVMRP